MRAISEKKELPSQGTLPKVWDATSTVRNLRRLVWLYLLLLIFEGVFRKWIIPQLSGPLLIIRDPVVVAIYVLALRARLFPQNIYTVSLAIIALLSWATGIIVLLPLYSVRTAFLVTGFGVRSDFLHLPLIFIIPAVLDIEDVKLVGRWTIIGMIPMAVLMAWQFAAPADSFVNRVAGVGESLQIQVGGGKIRPPGVFSFVSGTVYYLSAATAFLLHAAMARLPYKTWLLAASGASLLVGLAVSGSRSTVLAVAMVILSVAVILLIRPSLVNKFWRNLVLAIVVLWAISYVPIFQEGLAILSTRFVEAAESTDTTVIGGMIERALFGFTEAGHIINSVPLGGFGLGVGTNGGAVFLTGQAEFLLAENEWSRMLLESGPIIGLAFIVWRCAIAFKIGRFAIGQIREGNTLPLFLFSAGAFIILQGPFGQPTSLGFAVVLAGLSLAAKPVQVAPTPVPPSESTDPPPVRLRRRSRYADRLHDSTSRFNLADHGFVDR
jgi:hypothetical protein